MGLAHPVRARLQEQYGNSYCKVAVASMCGFRLSMEDAHTINLSMPRHPNAVFIGIYDGHGGKQAAKYCSSNLMNRIDSLDDWSDKSLKDAVMKFDAEFCSPDNPQREHGCTSVFVIIEYGAAKGLLSHPSLNLTICNSGDSRAIWSYRTPDHEFKLDSLTDDHKPNLEEETARIVRAGGFVSADRVDGDLALSRAIGDWKYKCNPDLAVEEQKVIALPDIERRHITSNVRDGYLLVACDGIFERLTNIEVHSNIYGALKEKSDPLHAVNRLLEASLVAGSKDNMSAALVVFQKGSSYQKDTHVMDFGPIYPEDGTFMATFCKFCEENNFKEEANDYIVRWNEVHGIVASDLPDSPQSSSILPQELLERLIAGTEPILVSGSNGIQQRIMMEPNGNNASAVISFTNQAATADTDPDDPVDDEQMEEVTTSS